jgi:hypothetical protein
MTDLPLKARCHCGATQFEVTEAPAELTDCNCSFCSRRGALYAYYKPAQFRLTTARDRVSTYQWGHYLGQHHHCGVCGCPTYSEFPSFDTGAPNFDDPRISINARLLVDFDWAALPVKKNNGKAY